MIRAGLGFNRIGIPGHRPTRYLFWGYLKGDIDRKEARDILVSKYHFGPQGAENALTFVKEHPHLVHEPTDYREILVGGEL